MHITHTLLLLAAKTRLLLHVPTTTLATTTFIHSCSFLPTGVALQSCAVLQN